MNILEKDLEEIIEKTKVEDLNERGLYVEGKCKRQLRIGNYGVLDLVYISKDYILDKENKLIPFLKINICELKKEKAGISAFLQAVRYAKGIVDYLINKRKFYFFKIEITLIAPLIDTESDYIFITDLISGSHFGYLSSVTNYSVKYDFDGVFFKAEEGYTLKDKGFK